MRGCLGHQEGEHAEGHDGSAVGRVGRVEPVEGVVRGRAGVDPVPVQRELGARQEDEERAGRVRRLPPERNGFRGALHLRQELRQWPQPEEIKARHPRRHRWARGEIGTKLKLCVRACLAANPQSDQPASGDSTGGRILILAL